MRLHRPLTRGQKFTLLTLMPIYFIFAGILLQPLGGIWDGLVRIVREPDFLITDYFVIGGIGAAFANAGLLTLIYIGMLYFLGLEFDGHSVTSTCLMFGFSLFGKNLLNIWLIMFGVFLYAKYDGVSLGRYIYIGLYGTCLSPIITQMMTLEGWPFAARFVLSGFIGIVIGFVLPPLCAQTQRAHGGYSLYNVGFASGIIATVVVSVFKSFGYQVESRLIWSEGNNKTFVILLSLLFIGMILTGCLSDPDALQKYKKILKSYGLGGTDYVKEAGGCATIINLGVNGLVVMCLVVLVGAELNGPTIGSIFTVLGFSATGKHVRNILPVMLGVLLASFAKQWSITNPSATLAMLLSTTLAPIAGEFGVAAGVLAGFLHSSVALNVGIVYSGMNLYNNGFAGGLTATFLVPVLQSIKARRARA